MSGVPRIKICGVTRLEDARICADLGVEAIGFVFASASKRRVDPAQAAAIIERLDPFLVAVGVFEDQPADEVSRVAKAAGVHCVQLHGHCPPTLADEVGLPAVRAISVRRRADVEAARGLRYRGILFDGPRSGSGAVFDSDLLLGAELPEHFGVAGGLSPENVGAVVRKLHPAWVDVASGVESKPGIKDPRRIEEFVRAARGALP